MNFAYGVIAIVGVLAAIILGFIAAAPDDIIKPRMASVEEMAIVSEPTPEPEAVEKESIEEIVMEEETMEMEVTLEEEIMMDETMDEEMMMEEEIEEPEAETLPMALTVSIPAGVGAPGCEETNECYFPYSLEVSVGDTVIWNNDDIAAHTVTSGNFPEHDGLFDSSVFLSGDTFEFTFSDAGTFDYYCFVHPWMAGIVNVS